MRRVALDDRQLERSRSVSLSILGRTGIGLPHPAVASRFADAEARIDRAANRVRQGEAGLQLLGRAGLLGGRLGGERRPASLAEVLAAAVLVEVVRHTAKPVTFWFHDRSSARGIVELPTAIRGGEKAETLQPLRYPLLEPISPLRFPFNGVDLLFETSRLDMPVAIGPIATTGVAAPVRLAGTMVLVNAEVLAGICHTFDMSSSQLVFACPEQALFSVAMAQVGKSYGLPVHVNAGLTDAKAADAQAGLEAGIALALAVEAAVREVDLSDEALGLDLVDERGPGGGFLDTDRTADHFRRELWFPRLLDRSFCEPWRAELLATHRPAPCPEPLRRAMDGIVAEARRELGGGEGRGHQ